MTSVLYGVDENYVDVTGICLGKVDENNIFLIPADDFERNHIFHDPLPNVPKHILLRKEGVVDLQIPTGWSYNIIDLDKAKKRYKLSIACLFRDGTFYLKEWIEFHLLVGVEHFYLGNHLSIDNYLPILQPYIDTGIVELIQVTDIAKTNFEYDIHVPFMNQAIKEMKYRTEWLALIDVDEFITPVFEQPVKNSNYSNYIYTTLTDMKKNKADLAGVALNWVCYGNANVSKLGNNEFIMEKLNMRSKLDDPLNNHLKCIVYPFYATEYHVHNCCYEGWFKTYDMSGQRRMAAAVSARPFVDKLRLTHYKMADIFYYHWTKMPFYADYILGNDWKPDRWLTLQRQSDCSRHNEEKDDYMAQFASLLREKRGIVILDHHKNDQDYDTTLTIMYGTHGALKDITSFALKNCREEDSLVIEPGDVMRAKLFGDPCCGTVKHVFVARGSQIKIYRHDERIIINV